MKPRFIVVALFVAAAVGLSGAGATTSAYGQPVSSPDTYVAGWDAIGSQAYNQRLSQLRAESVADALVSAGVNRRRLHARGFGKSRPVAPNTVHGRDDPQGRAKNRRVEVIIENPRRDVHR